MRNLDPLSVAEATERRQTRRREIGSASTLRDATGSPLNVTVYDLSIMGFSFTADTVLPKDSLVRLGMPGVGTAVAKVCRIEGRMHGCEFMIPLKQSQLDAAFRSDTVVKGAFSLECVQTQRFPEPAVEKWVGFVRAGLVVTLSGLAWGALWMLV